MLAQTYNLRACEIINVIFRCQICGNCYGSNRKWSQHVPCRSHVLLIDAVLWKLWGLVWLELQEFQFPLPYWLVPEPRPKPITTWPPPNHRKVQEGSFALISANDTLKEICWMGSKNKVWSLCKAARKVVFSSDDDECMWIWIPAMLQPFCPAGTLQAEDEEN